mmetsp:Transcript_107662/g.309910  ORF Transcript_107662/g.309910 Transcript_107662/m.309910 type:complete len:468 (+) Transcript_107662:152-1555(+)
MRRPRRQRAAQQHHQHQAPAQQQPATGDDDGTDIGASGSLTSTSRHLAGTPEGASRIAQVAEGPFGGWSQAELRRLPRFPHRDSFPMARALINDYLFGEGTLCYRDLQIALFWLGFGLLDIPTPEEQTLGLVPLCKDLNTYADVAQELGYDPTSSVHCWPVCRPASPADTGGQHRHQQQQPQQHQQHQQQAHHQRHQTRQQSHQQRRTTKEPATRAMLTRGACTFGPAATSSSSGSSSSAGACAAIGPGGAPRGNTAPCWQEQAAVKEEAFCSSDSEGGDEDINNVTVDPWSCSRAGAASSCGAGGGAASSHRRNSATAGVAEVEVLPFKVKLLHAGGWSSSSGSGSSAGQRTPPTPHGPAGSSGGANHGQVQQGNQPGDSGGLGLDTLEQFTISFVSGLQLHEDLEETSVLCTVCLEEMQIGEELCRLPCMHTFHRCCVHAWLARDRRCMLCRLDVTRPGDLSARP